jgi:hypothetical protein
MLQERQNNYLRERAVNYALKYALSPNPEYIYFLEHGDGGGDCSNFISQCLRAGGAPMDFGGPRPWWYNKGAGGTGDDRWSVSWAVAHSLYWCLKVRNELKLPGLKGEEVIDINMLEMGDVIQYENYSGIVYHSGIVTSFGYEGGRKIPLISHHTYNAINVPYFKHAAMKMHFMKIRI